MVVMKHIVLFSCWIALASYCVPAIIAGPSGILELRRAASSADAMRVNLGALTETNAKYARELERLHTLPETTALEARSLGYIADDEKVVRLPAAVTALVPAPNPGNLVIYIKDPLLQDAGIKHFSAFITVMATLAALVLKFLVADKWRPDHRASLAHDASRT